MPFSTPVKRVQRVDAPAGDSNPYVLPAIVCGMNGVGNHGLEDEQAPTVSVLTMPTTRNGASQPSSPPPSSPLNDTTNGLSPFANPSKPTGKVIERLTTTNERLTRELHAEKAKTQSQTEELRAKLRVIEHLNADKETLQSQVDSHERRKNDWKEIERSLTSQLHAEQERRKKAEGQVTGMGIQLDQVNSNAAKKLAEVKQEHLAELANSKKSLSVELIQLKEEFTETRKRAIKAEEHAAYLDAQSKAFTDGHRRIVKEQRNAIDELRKYSDHANYRVDEATAHIKALDVVAGQQSHEMERMQRGVQDMQRVFNGYKEEFNKLKSEGSDLGEQVQKSAAVIESFEKEADEAFRLLKWAFKLNNGDLKKPE
ncbi:uncharacterized protein K452DRAFT_294085 [Aplosporella prunicola CBS 121167]|uniref:SWI5-dependent HO expression protein 3 n=1 Tax=Aplosporella prunicola CBS 121167 TaxID=1176127 RepID=A0A6A6BQY0_9PEZI|nr:uncharacterized protein K452DRAFT_294085 [Aplosporella prunicola CBS 121167]KAF2146519.1 hypothetical protein K452DRAFT_294085 [Aplosporella prunicola CBS 121167]